MKKIIMIGLIIFGVTSLTSSRESQALSIYINPHPKVIVVKKKPVIRVYKKAPVVKVIKVYPRKHWRKKRVLILR